MAYYAFGIPSQFESTSRRPKVIRPNCCCSTLCAIVNRNPTGSQAFQQTIRIVSVDTGHAPKHHSSYRLTGLAAGELDHEYHSVPSISLSFVSHRADNFLCQPTATGIGNSPASCHNRECDAVRF